MISVRKSAGQIATIYGHNCTIINRYYKISCLIYNSYLHGKQRLFASTNCFPFKIFFTNFLLIPLQKIIMKRFFLTTALIVLCGSMLQAQTFTEPDKSPMDMAYYPNNFTHDRKPGDKATIRVTYSRPQKNEREIFGKLVPYDKVWRTGANEATEIKFYQDVMLAGKKVKAGNYSLFTIPGEKEWTIILNSDLDYWGAYTYNEKNDVLRIQAPATELAAPVESFTIQFEKKGDQEAVMKFAWDKALVDVPVTL